MSRFAECPSRRCVEHRQALSRRPGRGLRAHGAQPVFLRPESVYSCPTARSLLNRRSARIRWRTTFFGGRQRRAATSPHCRPRAERARAALRPTGGERRDGAGFLGGRQSHAFTKGAILPPPGEAPVFHDFGAYAEESLTPADPDFEVWDIGYAALAAAAAHLGIDVSEFLYARVDVIGDRRDARLLELELVEPSLGWRQWTTSRGCASSASSHLAWNQPSTGWDLVRCRIDAHSAAVTAVPAAAPVDRDECGRHTGAEPAPSPRDRGPGRRSTSPNPEKKAPGVQDRATALSFVIELVTCRPRRRRRDTRSTSTFVACDIIGMPRRRSLPAVEATAEEILGARICMAIEAKSRVQ